MVEQRLDDGGRRGHHVGADLRAFQHMDRVADAGDQDFGGEGIIVVDQADVLDQLRSEEHTSELQSLMRISYAVFCLKKKKHKNTSKISETKITKQDNTN